MDSQPSTVHSQHAAYLAQRSFGSLDGVRAWSVLAVIWHHSVPIEPAAFPLLNRGFLGVDMFFVLSGFLIVTLLLRERDRHGTISLKNFYARRTLRIFPVYYGLLAALGTLYLLKPDAGSASTYWDELPYYLTYTSNWIKAGVFPIAWSLAAEEQFYLLWPPIERFLRGLVWPALALVIGVSQAVNFGLLDPALEGWLGASAADLSILQATFTPIALGVGLAHLLHRPTPYARLARWLAHPSAAPLALAAVFASCSWPIDDLSGWPRLSIQLAFVTLLASLVMREDHALRPLLYPRPLRRLGQISYGMYLFHIYFCVASEKLLVKAGLASGPTIFLVATLATAVTAELSFRFFESPILRFKRRFAV
jgi:peptidoglycan/LPS O-acetylase OafA/YrhL